VRAEPGRRQLDSAAQAAVGEAIETTANGSDPSTRVKALLGRADLSGFKGASVVERMPDLEEALAIAEATGAVAELGTIHLKLSGLATEAGRLGEARRELEIALDAARRSGDLNLEGAARGTLGGVTWSGTNPALDIQQMLAANLAFNREHNRRGGEAFALRVQAVEAARHGRIPKARRLMAGCLEILEDLGLRVMMVSASWERGLIEFLAGDSAARERVLREGYEQLSAMGERAVLSTIAADLADALLDLGRLDEAEAMCAVAEQAGAEDDVFTQVRVGLVRGRLAAERGDTDEALASVADALALADQGEFYELRTTSRLVFAPLLLEAGRLEEARARAQEVVDLAQVRGDVIFEARARDLIERTAAAESQSH